MSDVGKRDFSKRKWGEFNRHSSTIKRKTKVYRVEDWKGSWVRLTEFICKSKRQ